MSIMGALTEREYVLAFGPAAPEYKICHNLSVHQCGICKALVVEDYIPEHERWHETILKRSPKIASEFDIV